MLESTFNSVSLKYNIKRIWFNIDNTDTDKSHGYGYEPGNRIIVKIKK